jgi:hypothetical protein
MQLMVPMGQMGQMGQVADDSVKALMQLFAPSSVGSE